MNRGKALLLATLLGVLSSAASALQITSPANNARLPAGPDYATDVLVDPWDMSNPEDISIDNDDRSGFSTFGFGAGPAGGSGVVGGTSAPLPNGALDTTLFFLNRGYFNLINTGRTGGRYPIDSSAYKKISFKLYSGIAGQLPRVNWYHRAKGDPASVEQNVMFVDRVTDAGWTIMLADTARTPAAAGLQWSSAPVVGLRMNPVDGTPGKIGHDVFFDWVRITRANGDPLAATMQITWDGGQPATVIEFIDAGNVAFSAFAPGDVASATSPYTFNYGVLPPGAYTLRIVSGGVSARSTFIVNDPARTQVTDPNETGGEDFATTVLANPWDMSGPEDVAGLPNLTSISFAGGQLSATNTSSDPQIVLLNSSTTTIDTSRYRFLTYRMRLEGPQDICLGSVARVFWSTVINADGPRTTTSKDIIVWPGTVPGVSDFVTYSIDLGSLTTTNGGLESTGAQQLWGALPVRYFRLDPHEFGGPTVNCPNSPLSNNNPRVVHLDDVKLAAYAQVAGGGTYPLKYSTIDSNAQDVPLVKLFYAIDKNPASRVLIASNLPAGAVQQPGGAVQQYPWNVTGVPAGLYWIYSEVFDGIDTRGQYSTGQIMVLPPGLPAAPTITSVTPTGNATAAIALTPPSSNGGSPITAYMATCTPTAGGAAITGTGGGSPVPVTGLTNGVSYTCTVHATNAIGNGPESAPSTAFSTAASNTLNVLVTGTGTGGVTGTGITCPGDCTETFPGVTSVSLLASPTLGSIFTGWLGACTGTNTTCVVNVTGVKVATATFAPPRTVATLDIDDSRTSTKYDALSDGLLVIRYLFNLTGNSLVAAAVGATANRNTAATIVTYLDNIRPMLDVDGNGQADALTDGLMILRKLFAIGGNSMTAGAIGAGATRNSAATIEPYIQGLMP